MYPHPLAHEPPDIGLGTCDFLTARYVLGFDTEAYRFPVHTLAVSATSKAKKKKSLVRNPVTRMVCSSWAGRLTDPLPPPIAAGGEGVLLQRGPRGWRALLDRTATFAMYRWAFTRDDVLFVAHNAAYDLMSVLHEMRRDPAVRRGVFAALADGRVADTAIREKLLVIGDGTLRKGMKFDLASCVKRRIGQEVSGKDGEDAWRLRYNELDGVPLREWPTAAVDYAILDAEWALYLALAQSHPGNELRGGVIDETRQCRAALALMLQTAWSVPTDPVTVAEWGDEIETALEEATRGLVRLGVVRVAGDRYSSGKRAGKPVAPKDIGTKDTARMRALVEADLTAQGLQVPLTPKGFVKTGAAILELCNTPELAAWAKAAPYEKYRSTYLTPARIGTEGVLPYSYDVLKATGRTSSYAANCQNPPKKGRFRECVMARHGYVLASIDFDAAELKGLGCIHYWMFGVSVYRDMAARGIDLHAPLAAAIWGKTLDEYLEIYNNKAHPLYQTAKTIYRQLAKAGNFGGWGGLGPVKFSGVCQDQHDVDLAAIARITGDAEEYERKFASILLGLARGNTKVDGLYILLPEAKGSWGLAYRDADMNIVLPDTPTIRDRYIRYSFAKKLLDVLKSDAIPEGGRYLEWVAECARGAEEPAYVEEDEDEEDDEGADDDVPVVGGFTYTQWVSQRPRAGCNYTNGANTGFQGIVADGAKEALWRCAVMSYLPPEDAVGLLWRPGEVYWGDGVDRSAVMSWATAMFGIRPVLFIHDEIIFEGPDATAHEWAPAAARVMCEAMATFIRDVHVTASPALMYTWDKRAEPAYDAEGKLKVWTPPS